MRSRSTKQGSKGGMEIERIRKLKEEPQLSGAYIRSLVKQLTSSKTKDPTGINPIAPDIVDGDGFPKNLPKFNNEGPSKTPQAHQPQLSLQPRKQVRRRLHTSRPYQERLLNMAEARREIVTALKFHRAAMKQANDQQQQQQQQQRQQSPSNNQQQQPSQTLHPPPQPCLLQQEKTKSRRNPRIYPSDLTKFSTYVDNLSNSSVSCPNNFSWGSPPIAPFPTTETLNLILPRQPLGLNLNFHDFNYLDATLYNNSSTDSNNNNFNNPSLYSSLSSSSLEVPLAAISPDTLPITANVTDSGIKTGGLHPAMDDEEMAEIRSIGEQHQMEWNDRLNLVTSAWWFKFLKTMEIDPERKAEREDEGFHLLDEVMEFPSWLNANENCNLQQQLEDYRPGPADYVQEDPALPCMDIGEIDGMDGEWIV